MMVGMRSRIFPALALAFALAASTARAQETPQRHEPTASDLMTARAALKEGLALRDKGDHEGAFMRFQTSYDIVQTPVTAFELGKTHMILGRILQAHELFVKIGRMPKGLEESERSAAARDEAARLAKSLEPRIPTVRIRLKLPPGATAKLRVDDDVVTPTGETTPRAVDPGAHEIAATAGDGPEVKMSIDLREGETKDIELAPQWIPPKPKEDPKAPSRVIIVRQTNPLVFIGFGAAAGSLVATVILGTMAANFTRDAKNACGDDFCPEEVRNDEWRKAYAFSIGALVTGGAAIVFTVVGGLALSRPVEEKITAKRGVKPVVGPGGVGLVGTF